MKDVFYSDFWISLFIIFALLGVIMLINVAYFQIRYQKRVDQLLHGDRYIDGGWIFNSHRMMMYAHYCLFKKRAEKAGLLEKVLTIPTVVKLHLVFHWGAVILLGLILVGFAVNDYLQTGALF